MKKKKGSSQLKQRVIRIERIKPQLPRARGPIKRVRFFTLRDAGVEVVGDLVLRDGRIIADPPDSIALQKILAEPVWVPEGGGWHLIYADLQPEEFLTASVKFCGHGSYFWCEAVT